MGDKDKNKQDKENREILERGQAATLAVSAVIKPPPENLVDVSNISVGIAHSITMLKAYHEQIDVLLKQLKERRIWYIKRYIRRQADDEMWQKCYKVKQDWLKTIDTEEAKLPKGDGQRQLREKMMLELDGKLETIKLEKWTEVNQKQYLDEKVKELETHNDFDCDDLFLYKFLMSYCHVSRGKQGKLLGILEVLADTDLQTRNPDQEDYGAPLRRQ